MAVSIENLVAKAGVSDIDQACSREDVLALSDYCEPWELVGEFLNLQRSQLSDIDRDNRTAELKRLALLHKWRENFAFKATFRVLVKALISCKKVDQALQVCKYLSEKEAKSQLDRVIDDGNEVSKELGQIAASMYEWEGRLSDELGLGPAAVEGVKLKHPFDLNLQAREALQVWKRKKGPAATFNNLIKAFESAYRLDLAETVRKVFKESALNKSSEGACGVGISPSLSQASLVPRRSEAVKPKHLQLIKWKDEQGETQRLFLMKDISYKWRIIGERIDLSFSELENIATENMGKGVECCRSVLNKWLDHPPSEYPATWDGLIELLEDCELSEFATKLDKALL